MEQLKNSAAEKAIIQIICHEPHRIPTVDEVYITSRDFTSRALSEMYQIIKKLYLENITVELESIVSTAKEMKFSFANSEKNIAVLSQMCNKQSKGDNLKLYCQTVRNLSLKRMLLHTMDKAKESIIDADTAQVALDAVEKAVCDFGDSSVGEESIERLADFAKDVLETMSENPTIGVNTGMSKYDEVIGGGLRPGTINVIGARPKVGKSLIALSIALNVANQGIPVLYLDTELSRNYQIMRMIGALTGIKFENLESGMWRKIQSDVDKFKQASGYIKNLPLYWVGIAGKPIEEITGYMRRFMAKMVGTNEKGKYNKCLIVYDYLKLMTPGDRGYQMKEYEALGYRMSHLHDLMVKYEAAMLMTLQLNRDGIDKEDSSAASGSDRIVWLCDSFTIFKQLSHEEKNSIKTPGATHKLVASDVRYGPGTEAGEFIALSVDKTCGKFRDLGLAKPLKPKDDDKDDKDKNWKNQDDD